MQRRKETLKIPEGIEVQLDDSMFKVKGKLGEIEKKLHHPMIEFRKRGDELEFMSKSKKKNFKSLVKTYIKHLENMMKGVQEGFTYKLKIYYVHFPMSAKVEGNQLVVSNFMGEKFPRRVDLPEGVNVKVEEDNISVHSIDKEKAGQTAANIENKIQSSSVMDKRKYMDGIYIVNKP